MPHYLQRLSVIFLVFSGFVSTGGASSEVVSKVKNCFGNLKDCVRHKDPIVKASYTDNATTSTWNGLRTTYSLNESTPFHFSSTGRTIAEAEDIGFRFKDQFCTKEKTRFRGLRYWIPGDPGIALLFDIEGTIAGIQNMIPKSTYTAPDRLVNRPLVDDGDYWTLTAYFVHPDTICTKGRSNQKDLKTGDRLIFQNTGDVVHKKQTNKMDRGELPKKALIKAPLTEDALNRSGQWMRGNCVSKMGWHYILNFAGNSTPSDQLFRMNLLTSGGRVVGMVYTVNAEVKQGQRSLQTSARYEVTTAGGAKYSLYPIYPKTLSFYDNEAGFKVSYNTLHVWFIDNPQSITCPPPIQAAVALLSP